MCLSVEAHAADICKAMVIRDIRAIENPESIAKRGETIGAITQYRVSRKSGQAVFCSHGGYCYPANGQRLLNCKIGKESGYNDPKDDEIFYSVDVVRSKNSAAALRYDDLDNRLLDMGLCSACASTAANAYLYKPQSHCAKAVRLALEGNPTATKALIEGNACE